jgi:tetratricopeptide (TPR) repeat protein
MNKNKQIWIWLMVFILPLFQQGYGQVNPDSLWNIWQSTSPDSIRLKALHDKAEYWLNINPDSALKLSQLLLKKAEGLTDKRWEARGHNLLGSLHFYKGDFKSALQEFQKSLAIREQLNDLPGMSASFSNITLAYSHLGQLAKALEFQRRSLQIDLELKDTAGISNSYNNLANIYQDQGDYKKALEFFYKSLELKDTLAEKSDVALIYNNLGVLYSATDKYDLALDFFKRSLKIREKLNDKQDIAIVKGNMGFTYIRTGDFDLSMKMLNETLQLQRELNDVYGIDYTYYMKGALHLEMKDFPKAIQYCKRFYESALANESIVLEQKACFCLYEAFKGTGDMKKALYYHELYKTLSDSIKQDDIALKLNVLEWEWSQQQDSLALQEEKLKMEVTHQKELRKKTRTGNILLILSLIIAIGALVLLSRMMYFQKSSEQFQSRAELLEKQKLINEIALLKTQVNPHFLFNSLSILSSLVRKNPHLSERFIDQLSKSYRYILEQNEENLVSLRTELEFIKAYTFLLSIRFEEKLVFHIRIEERDQDKYFIAPLTLQLLIENAVKHNKMSKKEPLEIEVDLMGCWLIIKNKLQPRSTPSNSTGIGLSNIKSRYALLTDREVTSGIVETFFIVRIPLLIHAEEKLEQDS